MPDTHRSQALVISMVTLGMPTAVIGGMIENVLEQCLWLGAIAAGGHVVHLDGDLCELAERMLRRFRPRARA